MSHAKDFLKFFLMFMIASYVVTNILPTSVTKYIK